MRIIQIASKFVYRVRRIADESCRFIGKISIDLVTMNELNYFIEFLLFFCVWGILLNKNTIRMDKLFAKCHQINVSIYYILMSIFFVFNSKVLVEFLSIWRIRNKKPTILMRVRISTALAHYTYKRTQKSGN